MKIKNKGKVYPSPSSSSSSSSSSSPSPPPSSSSSSSSFVAGNRDRDRDVLSVLKLLPAAILTLASVLSLEDREVLAYMITRSMKTTTNPSSLIQDSKKRSSKKPPNHNNHNHNNNNNSNHKSPIFDCDCFDCYTSYWFRWDSSPNRELIHQAIEAFEEHLTTGEQSRKNTRGKRRDKTGRRVSEKPEVDVPGPPEMPVLETSTPETDESSVVDVVSLDDDVSPDIIPEKAADGEEEEATRFNDNLTEISPEEEAADTEEMAVVVRTHAAVSSHKGLARKVLPDVLGLLNSRLWSLWSPNV